MTNNKIEQLNTLIEATLKVAESTNALIQQTLALLKPADSKFTSLFIADAEPAAEEKPKTLKPAKAQPVEPQTYHGEKWHKKRADMLSYIRLYTAENGHAPTYAALTDWINKFVPAYITANVDYMFVNNACRRYGLRHLMLVER